MLFDHFTLTDTYGEVKTRLPFVGEGGKEVTVAVLNRKSPKFLSVMKKINELLFDLRKPFLKEYVKSFIDKLDVESAYPHYDRNDIVATYKIDQIKDLVSHLYVAEPKLFSERMNKEQKNTFIRLLDLIMEGGDTNALFCVLEEILDMDTSEIVELADLIKYAKLSNITKTIKFIKDRYAAINDLKQLVFNESLNADEVHHLQSFIEQHYWVFGEQYNLVTAAEPSFDEALRRYLAYLDAEHKDPGKQRIDNPDHLKQMDIFAVRQEVTINRIRNIVVELKHPKVLLGEKELSQLKKYMRAIKSSPQFNASNMYWELYLVGNRFDASNFIELEIEPSLVFADENYKIYVKTWSEIFNDFEMRHNHINSVLNLEREKLQKEYESANEVVAKQSASAVASPKAFVAAS